MMIRLLLAMTIIGQLIMTTTLAISGRNMKALRDYEYLKNALRDVKERIEWLKFDAKRNNDKQSRIESETLLDAMKSQKEMLELNMQKWREWAKEANFDADDPEGFEEGERAACGICTAIVSSTSLHVSDKISENMIPKKLQRDCVTLIRKWPWGGVLTELVEEGEEEEEWQEGMLRVCEQIVDDFSEDIIDAVSLGEHRACKNDEDVECDLCRRLGLCERSRRDLLQSLFLLEVKQAMETDGLDYRLLSTPNKQISVPDANSSSKMVPAKEHPDYAKYFSMMEAATDTGGRRKTEL
eukprot:g1243.t1